MSVPITPTLCNPTFEPDSSGDSAPCPPAGASIVTDDAQVFAFETVVDFDVDVSDTPPEAVADAANDQILVGVNAVFLVLYKATYSTPISGAIRTRIKVEGITVVNRLDAITGGVPLNITEQNNIALNDGDSLTVTVAVEGLEGASVDSAALAVIKFCGPASDVIVPQG